MHTADKGRYDSAVREKSRHCSPSSSRGSNVAINNGGGLLSFSKAEAKQAKPAVLRDEIRKAFREDTLWKEVLPYLVPPGVEGNRSWDQCLVVKTLLAWDEKNNGGRIHAFNLPGPTLWKLVYSVLANVFETSSGRVVGLMLENTAKAEKPETEEIDLA